MGTLFKSLGVIAGLFAGATAHAEQWFTVSGPRSESAGTLVEIDLDTVPIPGYGGAALIRLSHDAPQNRGGLTYRSVVATAIFDCGRHSINLSRVAYFSLPGGQGTRIDASASGNDFNTPSRLLDSVPPPVQQALLKGICVKVQPVKPAS